MINVPIVTVGLIAIWRVVPETRNPDGRKLDVLGLVLSIVGLVLPEGAPPPEPGTKVFHEGRAVGAITSAVLPPGHRRVSPFNNSNGVGISF